MCCAVAATTAAGCSIYLCHGKPQKLYTIQHDPRGAFGVRVGVEDGVVGSGATMLEREREVESKPLVVAIATGWGCSSVVRFVPQETRAAHSQLTFKTSFKIHDFRNVPPSAPLLHPSSTSPTVVVLSKICA